jgi:hypothetical protein
MERLAMELHLALVADLILFGLRLLGQMGVVDDAEQFA